MKVYDAKPSFAGGELAPTLHARVDLAAYSIGAREITNFLVLPQGGLINRPGTGRLSMEAGLSGARLIPFVFSEEDSRCLVFRPDGDVDVYDGDVREAQVQGSPYTKEQLRSLRWLQSADVVYLFHRDVPVRRFERHAPGAYRFKDVEFKGGPYQDMNTDFLLDPMSELDLSKIEMSIGGGSGAGQTFLTSSVPYFTTAHVGLLFKLEFKVAATGGDITLKHVLNEPPYVSEEFMLFGDSVVESRGFWYGDVVLERKYPEDSGFTAIQTFSSEDDRNFRYPLSESIYGTMYRFTFTTDTPLAVGYSELSVTWTSGGGVIARQVKTLSLVDSQTMSVEPKDEITSAAGPSKDWAWGAFGSGLGYPSLGIFHQERLVLARAKIDKQTLWMSQPASWHDFGVSIPTEDSDGITVTLSAKQVNEIRGLASRSDLLILTGGGEWVASAGNRSDAFTPSSIVITPSGYRGSADIEPLDVGSSTLFVQRHGRVVRGMGYQLDVDGYAANELSILSAHLFDETRVVRWAYQQEPWSVVWVVLQNGDVLTLTMQQEHQVNAWTRQRFHHPIRDVCCIPGTDQDEVYFIAGDGDDARLLRLRHRNDTAAFQPHWYEDEGTNEAEGSRYTSVFEGLEWEQNVQGTLQGRHKHVPAMHVRVLRTCGFKGGIVTENNVDVDEARFPGEEAPTENRPPFSGDVRLEVPGGHGRVCRVRIENDKPHPVTLLGIFPEVSVDEEV